MAAGLAITFIALGQSVTAAISQTIGKLHFSFSAGEVTGKGAAIYQPGARRSHLDARRHRRRAHRDQFRAVQRTDLPGVGLGMHPLYSYRLSTGHWFTAAGAAGGARTASPPVVLGPAVARTIGARVGQIRPPAVSG